MFDSIRSLFRKKADNIIENADYEFKVAGEEPVIVLTEKQARTARYLADQVGFMYDIEKILHEKIKPRPPRRGLRQITIYLDENSRQCKREDSYAKISILLP